MVASVGNVIWRDAYVRFEVGREHTCESGGGGIFRGSERRARRWRLLAK
jgi:hypothetical protein